MRKKLFVLVLILLLTFPVLYGILHPEPDAEIFALNLNSLILVGGFAKVQGVFTGYKGKVGNTVYAMWKGIQVFKTKSNPANPQTSGQTTNRTLFTVLITVFKPLITKLVMPFWDVFATARQTGWANLIGLNQGLQAGGVVDYALLQLTKGSLLLDSIVSAVYTTGDGSFEIAWVDSGAAGGESTDFAMAACYDEGTNKWYFSEGTETRADALIDFTTEESLTVADLTCYLFFFTGVIGPATITNVSDSSAIIASAP